MLGRVSRGPAQVRSRADRLRAEGILRPLSAWAWRVESVAAAIAFVLLAVAAAAGAEPRAAWLFGGIAAAASVLHKVPATMLGGAQRWRVNSTLSVTLGAVGAAATVIALVLGGGITSIFVVLAVTNILMVVGSWRLWQRLMKRVTAPREPVGAVGHEILRFALAASIPVFMNFLIFQRSEFFFLNHYSTDAQIALYSIAFSVYASALALPNAIAGTFAPAVATLVGAGAHERIRTGYGRGFRLLLFVTVPLTAGALVFARPLVRIVYGPEYAGSGEILLVLLVALPLVPIGGLSTGLLLGYRRIRLPVIIGLTAGLVDVGLAALLVPYLDAMGAALANVSAQIVAAAGAIFCCVRLMGGIDLASRHLARLVFASAVAAGVAQLVLQLSSGPQSFVLGLALGVAVLAVLAVWLRVLPREDADWIAGAVAGRSGARRITSVCRRLSGQSLRGGRIALGADAYSIDP